MLRNAPTTRLAGLALLLVLGVVGVVVAARAGGAEAAVFAAIAVACGIALAARSSTEAEPGQLDWLFDQLLLLVPAALVIYLSFESGGFFPQGPAVASLFLIVVLILRITLVEEPLAGAGRPLVIGAGALALLALWTLASGAWSDAPGRALVEFDRTFMYLLLTVLLGSAVRTSSRLRWLAAVLSGAALVITIVALATRLFPDRFPTSLPVIGESNLAYPLTYSNALGILCTLGAIPALYFASSTRLPLAARTLGAAAMPLFTVTVYLTLSRGPVAAGIVGIAAFLLLGRPRGALSAAIAVVPTSAIAVASAYQHQLITKDPSSAGAVGQGHTVAVVVLLCVIGAVVLRVILAPLDRRVSEYALPDRSRRPVLIAAWTGLVLVILAVAVAVNAPHRISDQYHRFVNSGQASPQQQDVRQSLFSSANRGIVDNWKVALDAFDDQPLHGQGAGTYENWWNQHRPANQATYNVTDAHSLYVEVLGELGIVGFLLLAVLVVSVLVALAPIRRGPNRALYAALFATALAWAVHAGIDWDWEMPAVTVIFFALGGAALAAHASRARWVPVTQGLRVTAGLLLLVAAATPALIFTSQRQLNDARDALRARDCPRAVDRATASIDTLAIRADPYEVLVLCQATHGQLGLATAAANKAISRDPNNWRYHYDLGLLQGAAGLQPRPEIAEAHALNPHTNVPDLTALLKSLPKGEAVNWNLELQGPSGATLNTPNVP
ncbi:MAG TPA: O-antigen ligase family protein [Thermoleophilaceae bacterium]|nr:O-antigen ligase family protein [Thermoleophilaceae bacterium]